MCTQEVIWCACGHGEFLPIVRCPRGEIAGVCYTVLHGNHNVTVQLPCSACASGLIRLLTHPVAQPHGAVAEMIEKKSEIQPTPAPRSVSPTFKDDFGAAAAAEQTGGPPKELSDVVMTDFDNFSLDPELWPYQ